jgi:hypothetical protein
MQPLLFQKTGRRSLRAAHVCLPLAAAITAVVLFMVSPSGARSESGAGITTAPATCSALIQNGSFEIPAQTHENHPHNWTTPWLPDVDLSRDDHNAHSGASSVRISSPFGTDAWFQQEVRVEPETQYMLTGWIKTENVVSGTGANLSLIGTWFASEGRFGTTDWTRVVLWFNSGPRTTVTIGARLGYWWYPSAGTAWFDDLRLTPIRPDGSHPSWKILVLIYDRTDALVRGTDRILHHYVGAMTQDEVERAALVATQFVETDIPALTSGNMIPELTIRYPDHPLSDLEQIGTGWWPSYINTRADRDPAFDSVIVIWDPRVEDQYTGIRQWIGTAAGLAPNRYADQAYAAIIIEATGYGHRNVFKHEWGHSILSYFEEMGVTPQPAVSNHTSSDQYVHWPTGESYVWLDETDANPIANSIFNNESGFTHDYYSGTVATADQPTRRLGITPEAWTWGGPVTKPGMQSSLPAIRCNEDITVARHPGTCWASVPLTPPTVASECDLEFSPVATRSDGQPWYAPFECGQTVVTWSVTNSENRTTTCEQVVTVIDEVPPVFINIPEPVIVTTGPDATSCGTALENSLLGNTGPGSNPVVLDPTGDVYNPSDPFRNDIISTSAIFDRESLTFTVTFAEKIFSPWSGDPRLLRGFIEIDTDQNPATGWLPAVGTMGPPDMNLGVDFQINLSSEASHRGFVDITTRQPGDDLITGTVPILFASTSFSITVPLAMIGNDNGLVNYGVGVWMHDNHPTDRAPNGAVPATSVPVTAISALDDCAGVTISRSGVPANNVFPVGQTLITYTATDASGHTASVTQAVTVIDNTLPVISNMVASPSTLWPPNREMVDVTVSYQAADNCAILGTKLSVSSNEPDAVDWEVLDAHRVRLRAKRAARQGARLYTITITAWDVHGNVSSQNVIVRVPQSNGKTG